jgi:hypothetical protein
MWTAPASCPCGSTPRAGRDAGRIAEEVIAHLHAALGAHVPVTLEIEATVDGGVPEHVVPTVTENSRTLKSETHSRAPTGLTNPVVRPATPSDRLEAGNQCEVPIFAKSAHELRLRIDQPYGAAKRYPVRPFTQLIVQSIHTAGAPSADQHTPCRCRDLCAAICFPPIDQESEGLRTRNAS